jgi:hypothetical protein
MGFDRTLFIVGFGAAFAACAGPTANAPPNLTVGPPTALPTPIVAEPESSPVIQAIHLSSIDVARGSTWSGQIVTSTNVASVEVRTNLFSIDVPRRTFGRFAFSTDIVELPSIFIRPYALRVIARTAGDRESEEDVPFRLR